VLGKVVADTPSPELVDAYLEEIAKGYGLPWTSTRKITEAPIPTVEDLTTPDDKVPWAWPLGILLANKYPLHGDDYLGEQAWSHRCLRPRHVRTSSQSRYYYWPW
jgi:hypothetical protein